MSGEDERGIAKGGSSAVATGDEVDAFVAKLRAAPAASGTRGRLIFALDATASRQPTWDRACRLQEEMFMAAAALGGLEVQLLFYRGFGECKTARWQSEGAALAALMRKVSCLGGQTQIGKVLDHAVAEAGRGKVDALIFVGDAVEEDIDALCARAGQLGLLGLPAFLFHEGGDPVVRRCFEQLAKLSGGACCAFDASSAGQLRDLLAAVAVYAAGGRRALADYSARHGGAALLITRQLDR